MNFDPCLSMQLANLSKLAYQPPTVIEDFFSVGGYLGTHFFDNGGTQAYLIASPLTLMIVFRGTEGFEDWKTDLTADLVLSEVGPVHRGFHEAISKVWYDIESTILAYLGRENITRVYVTGHSLGGALATLAAAKLRMRRVLFTELHTFGAPRVGSASFANWMDSSMDGKHFRFVNNNDIVSRLPFPTNYRHCGELCYITSDGHLLPYSRRWARLFDRIRGRIKAIFERGTDGVQDHRIECYIEALEKLKNS